MLDDGLDRKTQDDVRQFVVWFYKGGNWYYTVDIQALPQWRHNRMLMGSILEKPA